ncbi:MAG: hypothetical protein KF708_20700 [Pirellulales bacterium]|nr:hypothetical protein [Pirellulales bacterium]
MSTSLSRGIFFGVVLSLGLGGARFSAAEEFRIETRVFKGGDAQPLNSTTTLFRDGRVYDIPHTPIGPWEVTIFDPRHGRFILLDTKRKLKTELQMSVIDEYVEGQRERARKGDSPFLQFLADPEFQESYDEKQQEVELESEFITYQLTTQQAASPQAMQQYGDFADGFTKLSPVLEIAAPPPFARLVVNQALRERNLIPDRVEMTARPNGAIGGKEVFRLRSEHHVTWKLLADDQRRIDTIGNQMATYRLVDFKEFRRPVETTANSTKGQAAR